MKKVEHNQKERRRKKERKKERKKKTKKQKSSKLVRRLSVKQNLGSLIFSSAFHQF